MTPTGPLPRRRRYVAEWLFLLAGLLALGGYIGYAQFEEYIHVETGERERLTSQAAVIEKNLVPQIVSARQAIDGILENLPSWKRQQDGFKLANQQLRVISDALAGIRTMLIVDAEGRVFSSNNEKLLGLDISQRDYFQFAQKNPNPETLHVTPPYKTPLNTFVMSLYRVIPGPSGEFGGIVIASVDPQSFKVLLDSVLYTPDAWSFVAHGDGRLFMREPERTDLNGKDLAVPGSFFTRHRNSSRPASVFTGLGALGGEERMIALRTIQPAGLSMDKPLVVAVSRDLHTIFTPWYRASQIAGGMFGLLVLIAGLSLYFYQRRQRVLERLADRHQQQLEASDARQRAIFEASPDAELISDARGIITLANHQIESLLGYTADEMIGQSIEVLVPERFRAAHPQLRAQFAASPVARRMGQGLGVKALRKDGSEIDVEVSLSRIQTDQGVCFVSALRDVTERRQKDERIRELLQEQHLIFDNAHVGILLLRNRKILKSNQRIADMFGFASPAELEGKSTEILYCSAEQFREAGKHGYAQLAQKGFADFETQMCRQDGTHFWVVQSGRPLDPGSVLDAPSIWVYTDISERKSIEADLRVAAIAFEAQEGMVITDAHDVVLRINRAFTEITGYAAGEVIGRKMNFLKSDRHDAAFWAAMWKKILGNGAWQGEIWNRNRNGEVHPHWITITAVKGSDGAVSHYVGTYIDITERRRVEEELGLMAKVFTQSSQGIVITDAEARIVKTNAAFTQLTGYSADEVLGKDPKILSANMTPKEVYREMWSSLAERGVWAGELWDRRKTGELYPKWLSIATVRNKLGLTTHYVGSFSDISERKAAETRIKFLAHHDALTQLPNRLNLHERLAQVINMARRGNTKSAVLMIDLDRFKVINDTLGHHIGDQLLVEVARRLTQSVRETDIVARLGGDEFVVVLSAMDSAADATTVADKIVRTVSVPYLIEGHELRSSPSIGICIFPDDATEIGELIKYADVAMYAAKARGGRNHQFFTTRMNLAATSRMAIEADLRRAIERQEFLLHYQPQLDLRTGRLVGVEALLRWQHPSRGLVPPMEFIPIAEETGLIAAIGDWVLREACRQLKAWQEDGITHIRMSVNLSPVQFLDTGLPDQVQAALATANLAPEYLDLEVTESMAMNSPADTIAMLKLLAAGGIFLSMDDFGTGYSSLAYLKLFPLHVLKIDRSFVKDIETDPDDADICDVIVLLAHKLGLEVIAEGVETAAQLKFLLSIGCEKIQGYLLSKPLPADQAKAFIQGHVPTPNVGHVDLWQISRAMPVEEAVASGGRQSDVEHVQSIAAKNPNAPATAAGRPK